MQALHGNDAKNLIPYADAENSAQVTARVVGVPTAFSDHKGKDGECKAANDSENRVLRQKIQPHMVDGHGQKCDQL